ncbi:GNAT family N-acetyltransferase [Lysobacter niabensis]|uniref:GNAT family N-acetyltransferase n=1 Tax=Agrilutibacter niabensis TaxID=380628 RepID=UPI00360E9986
MKSTPLVFRPSAGPEYPRWSETLHDHSQVLIRPINKEDGAAERGFIEGLSAQARRYRFLGAVKSPSEQMIEQFTDIDYVHEVAFVAVVREDSHERIVGVSRYSTDKEGRTCECAVTVSDEWQQKGLGTLLMKHLMEVARARGIRTMMSIVSAENVQMRDLSSHLGFRARVDPDDASQIIHEIDL